MVDAVFQYGDEGVCVREKINLGQLPIMLKVNGVIHDTRSNDFAFA